MFTRYHQFVNLQRQGVPTPVLNTSGQLWVCQFTPGFRMCLNIQSDLTSPLYVKINISIFPFVKTKCVFNQQTYICSQHSTNWHLYDTKRNIWMYTLCVFIHGQSEELFTEGHLVKMLTVNKMSSLVKILTGDIYFKGSLKEMGLQISYKYYF